MKRQKWISLVVMSVFILSLAVGCSTNEKPTPEKQPSMEEPNISLYVAETGETKELPLEEYLLGVVAAEMDPNWPMEALAAQAIMARTFTLEKMEQGGVPNRGTDASTDINEFQAYDAAKINDNVKKAVEATKGKVATYDGKLIKAWFFADGGGKTAASSMEGLAYDKEETPYIHSVEDPGKELSENPNNPWEAKFSVDEVKAAINQVSGQGVESIEPITIAEKGESGRATKLQFGETVVSAPAFRLAIGSEKMKSTLLESISVQGGQVVMVGNGFGHGVGMSQWGARAMAEQGKNYEEIIMHFFKDIKLEQRYQ